MYTEFAEELLINSPGKAELRRRFLLKSLAFYEEFAGDEGAEPELRLAAAWAYKRIARLYFFLGDQDKADDHYHQAGVLAERLAVESPDKPDGPYLLALICFERSFVLEAKQKLPKALIERQRSLDLYQKQVTADPSNAEYQRARAHVTNRMGLLLSALGRSREAVQAHRRGLALARQLVADFPNEPRFRAEIGFCCTDLDASLPPGEGQREEAERITKLGLETWQELSDRSPWDAVLKGLVGRSHFRLAELHQRAGRREQAQESYYRAVAIYLKLAVDFPEQQGNHSGLARTLFLLLDTTTEPRDRMQLAATAEEILRVGGLDSMVRFVTATLLARCAALAERDPLLPPEQRRGAITAYTARIRQVIDSLGAVPPQRVENKNGLAWMLVTTPFEALRQPALAVRLAEETTRTDPGLAKYWNTLGVARYRNGDWKGAIRRMSTSMARNASMNYPRSYDCFFLAMAHWQLGDKGAGAILVR